ncbi:hypothetical protein [Burkholderia vietnamiensis]|uniref:ApeA N-terminal domain 1-containing protein n=1 Tax=Burkholderia vietnamiensis TaxID=60552 RepID=UPI000B27BB1C|nr:hypothetical protein [Burkholderia vietnamiensis]
MSKIYNHFQTYEWLGLFWTPNKEIEFPGKLTYTPENGLALEFMCGAGAKFDKTTYLYGVVATGEKVTIFGDFNSAYFGYHFGEVSIYQGNPKFHTAVFGAHVEPDDKFSGFTLDLTNFQEFCHPQGWKGLAKYSNQPLFQGRADDLSISIVNTGKFSFLGKAAENLFFCENDQVTEKISQAILEISRQHENEQILQRKDIGWELWIEAERGVSYSEVMGNIGKLENLLSLLIFSPVRRTEASILVADQQGDGKFRRLPFLSSLFDMSKHKIEVLQREISHFHQAITPRAAKNFSEIISNWFANFDGFQSFVPQIANRFGRYHEHELRASVVLNLTQLEAISRYLGCNGEKDKYDLPLKTYDKTHIREILKFSLGIDDVDKIGKKLSEMRGEIAHVGRPIKLLAKIGTRGLLKISRCLEVVITSHIYEKLGVPEANIVEFQKKENPI